MAALPKLFLRSNYRCRRMQNHRALDLTGWLGIPVTHCVVI